MGKSNPLENIHFSITKLDKHMKISLLTLTLFVADGVFGEAYAHDVRAESERELPEGETENTRRRVVRPLALLHA